ncbi:hypothetical protein HZS_5808 [Henneguya salminicola]|nr:hypothetical protein HZS_5808 [Henneguya salminicola]
MVPLLFYCLWLINSETNIKLDLKNSKIKYHQSLERKISFQNKDKKTISPFILKNFLNSVGPLEFDTKFDAKNQAIYILTSKKTASGIVNESTLYVLYTLGAEFHEIDLKYKGKPFLFTMYEVGSSVVVGYSKTQKIFVISYNFGGDWEIYPLSISVNKILLDPENYENIAIVSPKKRLYLKQRNEFIMLKNIVFADNLVWRSSTNNFYFLKKGWNQQMKDLFRAKISQGSYPQLILTNIDNYGIVGEWLWASFEKFFLYKSSNEIFAIVVSEKNDILLYSASLPDLNFVRVDDSIGKYLDTANTCIYMEVFEKLPGILIINKKLNSRVSSGVFTSISFNHGLKWTHVKLPKLIEGKLCEFPSCYLCLKLECSKDTKEKSFKYNEEFPSLITSYGTLFRNGKQEFGSMFVSIDAGYTWKPMPKILKRIEILDNGELLVGIPRQLYVIYYSHDFGQTWQTFSISNNSLNPVKVYHDANNLPLVLTIIIYDNNHNKLGYVLLNFTNIFERKCKVEDYEKYTPGIHKKTQCFQGRKGYTIRRRYDAVCQSIAKKIPEIIPVQCPCTEDDFGCAFGFFFKNGKCIKDKDMERNEQFTPCTPGQFVFYPSNIQKFPGDICEIKDKWKERDLDICHFTYEINSISILIHQTLKYMPLQDHPELEFHDIPISLTNFGNIKNYDINLLRQCLYILNEVGIIQLCYNTRDSLNQKLEKTVVRDYTLIGLHIDPSTNNLFYYNKTTISVMSAHSGYSKIILKTEKEMSYVKIFPKIGKIALIVKGSSSNQFCVFVMSIVGKTQFSHCYDQNILVISYDSLTKIFVIYLYKKVVKISLGGAFLENKIVEHPGHILESFVENDREYLITERGVSFGDMFFSNDRIISGHFHFIDKEETPDSCTKAHCDIFCFSLTEAEYQCDCPDAMVFNSELNKCECNLSHPACYECKPNEFNCDNQKCIHLAGKCNGVEDCGDHSDETNCIMQCEINDILCDNDSKCVSYSDICDGFNNCEDGKDELYCHGISTCNMMEYRCLNGKCIGKEKYCNGRNDCEDNSDEKLCDELCKPFEAKCDNGQCVMKSQICNDNFDCSDLSDERGCHPIKLKNNNISCAIQCEERCIPLSKCCDHIKDCEHGEDELNCHFKTFCPSPSKLMCKSEFLCYELYQKCDGFFDCRDQSDEIKCEAENYCESKENFKCTSSKKCVSINNYCDGVNDCMDLSDESEDCSTDFFIFTVNKNYITSINMENLKPGVLKFNWYTIKKQMLILYNISLISRHSISASIISWKYSFTDCIPTTFYIECFEDKNMIVRNFSITENVFVNYQPQLTCRVATCYMYIFNVSCSDFSETIVLKYYSKGYIVNMVVIPMMMILIVILILWAVHIHPRFRCCKIKFPFSNLQKSAPRRRLIESFGERIFYTNSDSIASM